MATETSRVTSRRIPIWTLVMITTGLMVYAIPGLPSQIVYDRSAILSGEGWRLITGNWVHFSISHLFYDLTTFAVAGWIIERHGYPYYEYLCILSAFLIGAVLLATQPEIHFYGGFSGIVYGSVAYLTLHGLKEAGVWRWVCLTVLFLMIGKIIIESLIGQFTTVTAERIPFVPVPLSHLVGGLTGLLIFWWTYVRADPNSNA